MIALLPRLGAQSTQRRAGVFNYNKKKISWNNDRRQRFQVVAAPGLDFPCMGMHPHELAASQHFHHDEVNMMMKQKRLCEGDAASTNMIKGD